MKSHLKVVVLVLLCCALSILSYFTLNSTNSLHCASTYAPQFFGRNNLLLAIVWCAVFSNLGTSMVWHAMRQLATKTFLLKFFSKMCRKISLNLWRIKDSDDSLNQIVVYCLPWQQKQNSTTIAIFNIFIGV